MAARRFIRLGLRHENDGFLTRSASPVETDLYITTGTIVAATRKRKSESSADDDFYSDPDHEDARPSKNTSSHKNKKIRIQSAEGIPRPKIGTTPMINMILYWGENKEETIKVLLDTGSSVPILADRIIKGYQIPVAQRPKNRPIQDYAG